MPRTSNGDNQMTCSKLPVSSPHETSVRTDLVHGDTITALKTLPDSTVDLVLFDPPYPHIKRPYGTLTESEWHQLMGAVLRECRRILKPQRSLVVVIQTNYCKVGRMRMWPWEFVFRAAHMWSDWGLVEDAYSHAPNALPNAGVSHGLLRKSVKWCVWLGPADCYRNQNAVLLEPSEYTLKQRRTDDQHPKYLGGARVRRKAFEESMKKRGGVTPLNMLTMPTGTPIDHHGHPAVTPYRLAEWWCKYLLPPGGTLVDPFCGSGTTLVAGLACGASHVIGIDKSSDYLQTAHRRLLEQISNSDTTSDLRTFENDLLNAKLLGDLPIWIDDAIGSGFSQSQVLGVWDLVTGQESSVFHRHLRFLSDECNAQWRSLGRAAVSAPEDTDC